MGRDQYVRIVEQGYLFPFGHRAVKVTITERKFDRTPLSNAMGAYLRQQVFVVVRRARKALPGRRTAESPGPPDSLPDRAHQSPGEHAGAGRAPVSAAAAGRLLAARRGEHDFQFKMVGVDWEGNTSEFTAPLIFVMANPARDQGQAGT